MTNASPPIVPVTPAAPLRERIGATFAAPRRLASLIASSPVWFEVLAISTVVAIVAAATMPGEHFLADLENPVTKRGDPVEITSDPGEVIRWGRYMLMLSALFGHPVTAFVLAGVLSLIFTVIGRGENSYTQHLSLVSHALLLTAAGKLVGIVLGFIVTGEPIDTTLASLIPVGGFTILGDVLALIDPFVVWALVVMAIGVAGLDRRRSERSAVGILLGGYAGLALLLAIIS